MEMETVIFAHGDCDGVASAAIAYSVYGGRVVFSHPVGLLGDLEEFGRGAGRVVVLDISLDERTWVQVAEKLKGYSEAVYVDHHPLPSGALESLERLGVRVVHEEGPSTAELAFRYFKPAPDMERVALYGAIGDYAIDTDWFREALGRWDIRSLYLEAGLLTLGLEALRREHERKREVVAELAKNSLPSSMEYLVASARQEARRIEEARRRLPEKVVSLSNIAYVVDPGAPLGTMALYASVVSGRRVGVAVELRRDLAVMSLRARDEGVDLNSLLRRVAPKYGGHGGGHRKAAGARVPAKHLEEFLREVDTSVSKSTE
ncbi:phosphoesterase [Infirmifilum lucidum]|uniref:Phosphoesterase n=1 Tax=Infirmifilum lucidum TaxID=2776706 RepID=A0A7L9FH81_9CREN|nr:DHHA1 domain-containing protein [Infirmifilum lucidum]QOJ79119.1 phosphoesterase [Infirmifilum lucidum]